MVAAPENIGVRKRGETVNSFFHRNDRNSVCIEGGGPKSQVLPLAPLIKAGNGKPTPLAGQANERGSLSLLRLYPASHYGDRNERPGEDPRRPP